MAIQYLGTSISGTSSDTKPILSANEVGVLFVETNTNKSYIWDSDSWNELIPTSAPILTTGRTVGMTGDVVWTSPAFTGSGNITAAAVIQANAVEGSMLNTNVISGQTALTSGLVSTDELFISDNGALKRMDVAVLSVYQATLSETLTNKSIDLGTNTLTGSVAEFNAALQSESFATLTGSETLTNKTLYLPTVGNTGWANATHAHAAANSGGQIATSALSGTIANSQLANNTITIGGTSTVLGGTITALTALTDLDMTSGNKTILDGVGSNTITIGASGTTVNIAGTLTIAGSANTISTTTIQVTDTIISLAGNNTGNAVDIGFYGKYRTASTDLYTGLVWDGSASKYILFHANEAAPAATTINTGGDGHAVSTLVANLEGNASGTAATVTGAAQTNITSLGTLLNLHVDNLILDASTISTASGDMILAPNGLDVYIGKVDSARLRVSSADHDIAMIGAGGDVDEGRLYLKEDSNNAMILATDALTWNQAATISTTSSTLTIKPTGQLRLDSSGGQIVINNDQDSTTDLLIHSSSTGSWATFDVSAEDLVFADATTIKTTSGNLTLTSTQANINFTPSGDMNLLAGNFKIGTYPAGSGIIRLENNALIGWRNAANNGQFTFGLNASNKFAFSANLTALTIDDAVNIESTGTAILRLKSDTDANSTDDAKIVLYNDGASSGDAVWAIGFDGSDSETFKISQGEQVDTAPRLSITSVGRVLVGTGTPILVGGQIDGGSSTTPYLQLARSGDVEGMLLSAHHTTNTYSSTLTFLKSHQTTINSYGTVADDEHLGSIVWAADDGGDYTAVAAQIRVEVDGTVAHNTSTGTHSVPGRMVFKTTAVNGNLPTTRMTILNNGNVGIGISPTFTPASSRRGLQITNGSNGALISMGDDASEAANPRIFSTSTGIGLAAASGGDIWFYDGGSDLNMVISGGTGTVSVKGNLVVYGSAPGQIWQATATPSLEDRFNWFVATYTSQSSGHNMRGNSWSANFY